MVSIALLNFFCFQCLLFSGMPYSFSCYFLFKIVNISKYQSRCFDMGPKATDSQKLFGCSLSSPTVNDTTLKYPVMSPEKGCGGKRDCFVNLLGLALYQREGN